MGILKSSAKRPVNPATLQRFTVLGMRLFPDGKRPIFIRGLTELIEGGFREILNAHRLRVGWHIRPVGVKGYWVEGSASW